MLLAPSTIVLYSANSSVWIARLLPRRQGCRIALTSSSPRFPQSTPYRHRLCASTRMCASSFEWSQQHCCFSASGHPGTTVKRKYCSLYYHIEHHLACSMSFLMLRGAALDGFTHTSSARLWGKSCCNKKPEITTIAVLVMHPTPYSLH